MPEVRSSQWVLSVAELNEYVKRLLGSDPILRSVKLRGEISNLKKYPSGHWYFTLKDRESRINCVMFRQDNLGVFFQARDGMAVVLSGSVSIYPKDGAYQFYARTMEMDGLGDLYLRFLQLKDKLEREGLFDPGRKRQLPLWPKKVGVVTSQTGAVIHDILKVSGRRNPSIPIVLAPVKVQGFEAAAQIAAAIRLLGVQPEIEVLIIGRGGGSLEDLWPFNEEIVARAIAACPVPVVSAVGHETDFTIADFAADVRAATPSHAAEMVFADVEELQARVAGLSVMLNRQLEIKLAGLEAHLSRVMMRLSRQEPAGLVQSQVHQLEMMWRRLCDAALKQLEQQAFKVEQLKQKRIALGPEQVLARGYVMALKNDVPITQSAQVAPGDQLTLTFMDGSAVVNVERTERKSEDAS